MLASEFNHKIVVICLNLWFLMETYIWLDWHAAAASLNILEDAHY